MICDLDDDITREFHSRTYPLDDTCSATQSTTTQHYTTIIRPAEQPVPTFTPVSDCYLPWQLLSSERFRLRRVDPLLTTCSWFLKSRVHETNVINVGWEPKCQNCGLGTGVLKTPKKGVKKGGQKGGQNRGQKPPLLGPQNVHISAA